MVQYSQRKFQRRATPVALWGIFMRTVRVKAYAKVNLTLEIVGAKDGFHLLDSFVASVDLFDELTVTKRKGKLSCVTMRGMGSESIPPERNNALKAAETFSQRFGTDGVDVTVFKNIPIGGGLGGSSADIAGVLNAMQTLYGITDDEAVDNLADELGSDVRFMRKGGYARMNGKGEILTPVAGATPLWLLLICPQSSVSAGACYRQYDETVAARTQNRTQACINAFENGDTQRVGKLLCNDLYIPAKTLCSDVEMALREAESFSPLGAGMTGSGSAVFALFETKELCEWAKSRYKGTFAAYAVKTVEPKKIKGWAFPFALQKD